MENKVTQEYIENTIEQYRKYVKISPTKYIDIKQPCFTLTIEEVEIVINALKCLKTILATDGDGNIPEIESSLSFSRIRIDNILTRIKQFKDESNTITK